MTANLSVKQLQNKLGCAVGLFAQSIVAALKEWVKAADDLRGHAQYACTEATRQLVQAALQQTPGSKQGPLTMQECDQLFRPWLAKHLPGISAAMQKCVSGELDITNKRISILQSLLQTCDRSQLLARIDTERRAFILVETHWWVLAIILPLSALCEFVVRSSSSYKKPMHTRHVPGQRLDDNPTIVLAGSLARAEEDRRQLHRQVLQARQGHVELGVPVDQGPPRHMTSYRHVLQLLALADLLWLVMAARVLPKCRWAAYLMRMIYGPQVGLPAMYGSMHPITGYARNQFCRLLAHPGSLSELKTTCTPGFIGRILQVLEVKAEHLQATSVPDTAQKDLLSMMEELAACDAAALKAEANMHQSLGQASVACHDLTADSGQQRVVGSTGAVGADQSHPNMGQDNDADMDNMQAL